jgi:hypothetical protein
MDFEAAKCYRTHYQHVMAVANTEYLAASFSQFNASECCLVVLSKASKSRAGE